MSKKLKFEDLKNESMYEFFDVSSEMYREYVWLTKSGRKSLVIPDPVAVSVSKSGHRVMDAAGESYFISLDCTYLGWKAIEGKPHFVI